MEVGLGVKGWPEGYVGTSYRRRWGSGDEWE